MTDRRDYRRETASRSVEGLEPIPRPDVEQTEQLRASMSEIELNFQAIQNLLKEAEAVLVRLANGHDEQLARLGDAVWETSTLLKSVESKLATIDSKRRNKN